MSGLWSGNQEAKNEGDKSYQSQLASLIAVVEAVTKQVDDIAKNLHEEYPAVALKGFSKQFEQISKDFTNYITIRKNPLFEIFQRSKDRLAFARAVAGEAKKLAQFFEKYSKSPLNYSAANSRIEINKLQAQLTNLKGTYS
jgi:hypothetical protein